MNQQPPNAIPHSAVHPLCPIILLLGQFRSFSLRVRMERPQKTRHFINEGKEVSCSSYWPHIHNCNISLYHYCWSTLHISPRRYGCDRQCSPGSSVTIMWTWALTPVHVGDNLHACPPLHGLTVSRDKRCIPDVWDTDGLLRLDKRLLFPDIFKIDTAHPIPTPVDTHDIPIYLSDKAVISELNSVAIIAQANDGSDIVSDFRNM